MRVLKLKAYYILFFINYLYVKITANILFIIIVEIKFV